MNAVARTEYKELAKDELMKVDFEKSVSLLAERLDFWDVQILRKFYATGRDFPFDTQPYCFPMLFSEMRSGQQLKIGIEALRKRLNKFVEVGLLSKVKSSNPTSYSPITGKECLVRAVVTKFFLIHGLTKFV